MKVAEIISFKKKCGRKRKFSLVMLTCHVSITGTTGFSKQKGKILFVFRDLYGTLGTRGNSLAKSGRPLAGKTSVRFEVSEGPNASSLWWQTPTVSL